MPAPEPTPESIAQSAAVPAHKLDDIMLAMDVVDTLRHRTLIVEKELGSDAREAAMIKRLREIYTGQGISVPDHILRDGVRALEENRFVYQPPKPSFGLKLAHIYVSRDRWLRPLVIIIALAALVTGIYYFGIAGPARSAFVRAEVQLSETRDSALELAQTEFARARISALYQGGEAARSAGNSKQLSTSVRALASVETALEQSLTIRIISRPGEMSGIFRIPDARPGARNYYLIVEAIDSLGRPVTIEIASEEDQKTARVTKWGVRVSEAVFDRVKADKADDQIIQNVNIGTKARGTLRPAYTIDTDGGAILDW